MRTFYGQKPACDPDEARLLLELVERAQLAHGGPVRSCEILAVATPAEFGWMPQSSRGLTRALERHAYQADVFGRTIRRARRNGHALWAVYTDTEAFTFKSTQQLQEWLGKIQAELDRRAREEQPQPSAFKSFTEMKNAF